MATYCAYLKSNFTRDELKNLAVALRVNVHRQDTGDDICENIKIHRPDLLRGRVWNALRAILEDLDLTNATFLKRIATGGWYTWLSKISWALGVFHGDERIAVGHGKYALERAKARKLLGYDPRKVKISQHRAKVLANAAKILADAEEKSKRSSQRSSKRRRSSPRRRRQRSWKQAIADYVRNDVITSRYVPFKG